MAGCIICCMGPMRAPNPGPPKSVFVESMPYTPDRQDIRVMHAMPLRRWRSDCPITARHSMRDQ